MHRGSRGTTTTTTGRCWADEDNTTATTPTTPRERGAVMRPARAQARCGMATDDTTHVAVKGVDRGRDEVEGVVTGTGGSPSATYRCD